MENSLSLKPCHNSLCDRRCFSNRILCDVCANARLISFNTPIPDDSISCSVCGALVKPNRCSPKTGNKQRKYCDDCKVLVNRIACRQRYYKKHVRVDEVLELIIT